MKRITTEDNNFPYFFKIWSNFWDWSRVFSEYVLRKNPNYACEEKCTTCCEEQSDIPVLEFELLVIRFILEAERREKDWAIALKKKFGCPFLEKNIGCKIHNFKPFLCKMFPYFIVSRGENFLLGGCKKIDLKYVPLLDADKFWKLIEPIFGTVKLLKSCISKVDKKGALVSDFKYAQQYIYQTKSLRERMILLPPHLKYLLKNAENGQPSFPLEELKS